MLTFPAHSQAFSLLSSGSHLHYSLCTAQYLVQAASQEKVPVVGAVVHLSLCSRNLL